MGADVPDSEAYVKSKPIVNVKNDPNAKWLILLMKNWQIYCITQKN